MTRHYEGLRFLLVEHTFSQKMLVHSGMVYIYALTLIRDACMHILDVYYIISKVQGGKLPHA